MTEDECIPGIAVVYRPRVNQHPLVHAGETGLVVWATHQHAFVGFVSERGTVAVPFGDLEPWHP